MAFLGTEMICSQTAVLSLMSAFALTSTLVGSFNFDGEVFPERQTKLNTLLCVLHFSLEMQQQGLIFPNKEFPLPS